MGNRTIGRLALAASICAGAFATGCEPAPTEGWRSELISRSTSGTLATTPVSPTDITADGTGVLLVASSSGLGVPGGSPSTQSDLFLRDLGTGELTRLSSSPDGTSGANSNVTEASFGPDDRSVLFVTGASNLGPSDTNATSDVYRYDLSTDEVSLVSQNAAGTNGGNGQTHSAWASGDGTKVAFTTQATDLGPADANGAWDVYVRDLSSGATELVSANAPGTGAGNLESTLPSRSVGGGSPFSADGRYLVFRSNATDLTGDPHAGTGVFVRDLVSGTTENASPGAGEVGAGAGVSDVALSPDGTLVAFSAIVSDASTTPPFRVDLFLRDLRTGTLVRLATGAGRPVFSPDGDTLAFTGAGPVDTGLPDTNGQSDVYVYDIPTDEVRLVSVDATGAGAAAGSSADPSFSGDGRLLAFTSTATDVVAGMPGTTRDLYVHDLDASTNELVSVDPAGGARGGLVSGTPRLDAAGAAIAYPSSSALLAGGPIPRGSAQAYVARVTPYAAADLAISIDAPALTYPGQAWTATLTVDNAGPDLVDGVNVLVVVPAGIEGATFQAPAGLTCTVVAGEPGNDQVAVCSLGSMAADASAEVVVSGTVAVAPPTAGLTVTGLVDATRLVDTDGANDAASATTSTGTPPTTVVVP